MPFAILKGGLRQLGEGTLIDDAGEHRTATMTCCHCNGTFHVPAGQRPEDLGGWCGHCDGNAITGLGLFGPCCVGKPCRPFESWLDKVEGTTRPGRFRAEAV